MRVYMYMYMYVYIYIYIYIQLPTANPPPGLGWSATSRAVIGWLRYHSRTLAHWALWLIGPIIIFHMVFSSRFSKNHVKNHDF